MKNCAKSCPQLRTNDRPLDTRVGRLTLPVMDGLSCDQYGGVSSTGCLQVLIFCISVSVSDFDVRPDMFVGWFGVEFSRGLGVSRSAYLKRFILNAGAAY